MEDEDEDEAERLAVLAPRRHLADKVLEVDLRAPAELVGVKRRKRGRKENLYEVLARQARARRKRLRFPEIKDALPRGQVEEVEDEKADERLLSARRARDHAISRSSGIANQISTDDLAQEKETGRLAENEQVQPPRKLHPLFEELLARRAPVRKIDQALRRVTYKLKETTSDSIKTALSQVKLSARVQLENQTRLEETHILGVKQNKMQRRANLAAIRMQSALERGMETLPMQFLLKYKLETYCQQRGGRRIVEILQAMLTRAQRNAMRRWVDFVKQQRIQDRFAAAAHIQRVARGYMCRTGRDLKRQRARESSRISQAEDELFSRCHERTRAAILIESIARMHRSKQLRRSLVRDLEAVVRVQTHWRGKRSRVAFVVLQELRARQIKAATRIQSAFRGMRGRRRARFRAVQARHEAREEQLSNVQYLRAQRFAQNGAALVIQKVWRRMRFRCGVAFAGHGLAVQMQRIVRGFLARRKVARLRELCNYEQWVNRYRDKVEEAALQVQVMYRARLANRELERLKHVKGEAQKARLAAKAGKLRTRNHRRRVAKLFVSKAARSEAATTIQRFWRGKLARRLIIHHRRRVMRERKHRAATMLQSLWRMLPHRIFFVAWRRSRAATRIQAAYRGHAVRALGQQRQRRYNSATRIESWWRMHLARVELSQRKHHYMAQLKIAGVVRCYAARSSVRVRLDEARAKQESALRGALEAAKGLRNEQSRLALTALHCNPARTLPQDSEPLAIFSDLVDPGAGRAANAAASGSTSTASRSSGSNSLSQGRSSQSTVSQKQAGEIASLGSAAFAKYCQSIGVQSEGRLKATEIDILFSKCCMGKRKMDFLAFVDALELLAEQFFPEVTHFRAHRDNDAQIARFLDEFVLCGRWRKAIRARTEIRAAKMAIRMQNMYRAWKSRQRARLARVARDYQKLLAAQTQAAYRIQSAWRQHAARQRVMVIMRSLYRSFIDTETGARFWQNPTSGLTTWTKPALLGDGDVDAVIHIPPARHQLIELCDRCEERAVAAHCEDCEIAYCQSCSDMVHKKGKRAQHDVTAIARCSMCKFQMATKVCVECGDLALCDCCADYSHRKGNKLRHELDWLVPEDTGVCQTCGLRAARFDQPYPTCSVCVEREYGLDPTTLVPRKFTTRAVEEHRQELHEARVRAYVLDQAQQMEEVRLEKERHRAAAKIQACVRGKLTRQSEKGKYIIDALAARRERIARAKEEAERKKLVNRFKANLAHVQKATGLLKKDVQSLNDEPAKAQDKSQASVSREGDASADISMAAGTEFNAEATKDDVEIDGKPTDELPGNENEAKDALRHPTAISKFGGLKERMKRNKKKSEGNADEEPPIQENAMEDRSRKSTLRISLRGRRKTRTKKQSAETSESKLASEGSHASDGVAPSSQTNGISRATDEKEAKNSDNALAVNAADDGGDNQAVATADDDVAPSEKEKASALDSECDAPKTKMKSSTTASKDIIGPEVSAQSDIQQAAEQVSKSDSQANDTLAATMSRGSASSKKHQTATSASDRDEAISTSYRVGGGASDTAWNEVAEPFDQTVVVGSIGTAEIENVDNAWEEYFDENQQATYYYNAGTGETLWKEEYDAQFLDQAQDAGAEEEADAWDEYFDETQQAVYYCNRRTGETVWKDDFAQQSQVNEYAAKEERYAEQTYAPEGVDAQEYGGYFAQGEEAYAQEYAYAYEQDPSQYAEGEAQEGGYWDEYGVWHGSNEFDEYGRGHHY